MRRISTLWKANAIAFSSSFCVMVLELIAPRMLAPDIGVSLYTWTSIIGVVLAGIAIGNYLGGKVADRYTSPTVLATVFFAGTLATVAVLPLIKLTAGADWFGGMPLMLGFVTRVLLIFFLPAVVLSMVSPMVIKLTLADLGQTGGVVGTIYAFSTGGAILGTFMTGFYFILWLGSTRMIVWLVAAVLVLTGVLAWFSWKVPDRWRLGAASLVMFIAAVLVAITSLVLFQFKGTWQVAYTRESNYYTIQVEDEGEVKVLRLDRLTHSYVIPDDPTAFITHDLYNYPRIFSEIVMYATEDNPTPGVLHLGGGGYTFPRYMETAYPGSTNDVVEIDPLVTEVAYEELGLPRNTGIKTYNQDARLFLIQRKTGEAYDFVVGDVFNDLSTPYHLTTLEFDRLVKANLGANGIYLLNVHDDYRNGRYMPSLVYTLQRVFKNVSLFGAPDDIMFQQRSTYVIAATDREIDPGQYKQWVTAYAATTAYASPAGIPLSEAQLVQYLAGRKPLLLTDDYAPTDILVAPLIR